MRLGRAADKARGSHDVLRNRYTGTWESDSKLRITLVDTTSASSQRLTRVGGMLVAAATGNNIKSFDATSGEATVRAPLQCGP